MRLDFVEMCGFRGFRDKIRVDFGSGFTVISGRNGVGKSTIFDAVEFALTGAIEKYTVEKSAKESISDYVWWRGVGIPQEFYVTVSFRSDADERFEVTRTREKGSNKTPDQIRAVLCVGPTPENAVHQLCKTSIIRDEWIAALSVDLTETERFDLVRAALGPIEGLDYAAKAKELVSCAEATRDRYETTYEAARSFLTSELRLLSESKEAVAQSSDIAAAMLTFNAEIPGESSDLADRLRSGRSELVRRRAKLEGAGEALLQGREIAGLQKIFNSAEAVQSREATRQQAMLASIEKDKAEESVRQAQEALAAEEQSNAIATSLIALIEHGETLGLHDDRCPLCAAARTAGEFQKGISLGCILINGRQIRRKMIQAPWRSLPWPKDDMS